MTWKMKDSNGNDAFPDRLGIGLHFTVMDFEDEKVSKIKKGGNYNVIEEIPRLPVTAISGSPEWMKKVFVSTIKQVWNN